MMKAFAILVTVLAMALTALADPVDSFEIGSPHFSTNTEIIWKAPTNHLPQSFWIYQRKLPHIFSEAVISNAIVLASLQKKGFPKPSTNDYDVDAFDPPTNYPGMIPISFEIMPGDAFLSYWLPNDTDEGNVPNTQTLVLDALNHARELGLDPAKLVQKSFYTDGIRGRGIFFSRRLDGLMFFSPDDQGVGAEGFFFELGSYGKISAFSVRWSDVERYQRQTVASPQEIIQCIRSRKIIVLPDNDGDTYSARLKQIGTAKRLVISKITPYYTDSIFCEIPPDNAPCKFITPVAELYAVADFGNSNMPVHLYAPITSSDVNRLLKK
jgi:hypothetical protein